MSAPDPTMTETPPPDKGGVILVGGRTPEVPGSQPSTCEDCGTLVWLAPSGQALRTQHALRVVCLTHGLAHLRQDPTAHVHALTREQQAEIAQAIRRRTRHGHRH